MQRSLCIVLLAIFGLLIAVGGGYWLGVRDGLRIGVIAEFGARGASAATFLPRLREGKTTEMVSALESDIDNSLRWSYELAQWPLSSHLENLWGLPAFPVDSSYVVRAAQYRASNPSPFTGMALQQPPVSASDEARALYQKLEREGKNNDLVINEMVNRYGKR